MLKYFKLISFCVLFVIALCFVAYDFFYPLYTAQEVIITYGIHPFDICSKNPDLWKFLKISYIFIFVFSQFVISYFIYSRILLIFQFLKSKFNKNKTDENSILTPKCNSKINLLIGIDKSTNF